MRFNKLDLNLLVALDALLDEASISRAAARVHLSQGAMSNALSRLRDHFDDELLVPVGRRMEMTPRAALLKDAVRDLLVRIDTTLQTQPVFDAATADRRFRICVSDYSLAVYVPHLLRLVHGQGRNIRFDLVPQTGEATAALERGEADVLVVPKHLASPDHPTAPLFCDTFSCLLWRDNPLAHEVMTLERYLSAGHVAMQPAGTTRTSIDAEFMKQAGLERRVEVTAFSFTAIPQLLIGTDRIATLQTRLAQQASQTAAVALVRPSFELPTLDQLIQWHKHRTSDPGLLWLRETMKTAARMMPTLEVSAD